MMIISIQQPEFFPWPGYFDKIRRVECVVILDHVQFKKRYFENRNRIRTPAGWSWMGVPVLSKGRFHQRLLDVVIDESQPWRARLTRTLRHSYGRAPHWRGGGGEALCELIGNWQGANLVEFNLAVVAFLMDRFGLVRPTVRASTLGVDATGSALILAICQRMSAATYLSGPSGKDYLDEAAFRAAGIELVYQSFVPPVYAQAHGGEFVAGLSAVDLLFNLGPGAQSVLDCAPA